LAGYKRHLVLWPAGDPEYGLWTVDHPWSPGVYFGLNYRGFSRRADLMAYLRAAETAADWTHNLAVLNPYPCRLCPRNLLIYGPASGSPVLALNP
jgi:hypothetical protein